MARLAWVIGVPLATLSLIGLLDTPTDGSYRFDEHDVLRLTAADRARLRNRQIGFIFQSFNLIGDLTVAENVDLPLAHAHHETAEHDVFDAGGV